MRSLFVGVSAALIGALSLSLLVFNFISNRVENTLFNPVFEAMDQLELEAAQSALEQGGIEGLHAYTVRLDSLFGPAHYVLTSDGIDVATGKSMASLLPGSRASSFRGFEGRHFVVSHKSANGLYWLLVIGPERMDRWQLSPYYFLVLGTTAVLCALVAYFILMPIRQITTTVKRFGRGDLTSRTKFTRRDEIGSLARSFDDMADRLERLVASERQMLQDLSHELRSPLTRVNLAIALARTSREPGAALDRIEREVDRLSALSAEIVEVARLEGDRNLLSPERVNLTDLVEEAAHSCRTEVIARTPVVRVDGPLNCSVECDRALILRAIENVLRNAIRFSPQDAPVEVVVRVQADRVSIVIRDYGPGVPAHLLGSIFQPFFRADDARLHGEGIGLGLSIVSRIVQLHRGLVTAVEAQPGLLVEMRLPISRQQI